MMNISLIIPVYNTEPWLSDCLDSVVRQSFYEIILINDGSTDNSREICLSYAQKFAHIQYFEQNNVGLGATRNNGLRFVTGDYVMFLDSDDFLSADSMTTLSDMMNRNKTDVIYFNANSFLDGISRDGFHNPYQRTWRMDSIVDVSLSGIEWFEYAFPRDYFPSSCLALYSVHFLKDNHISFPENVRYEDNPFSVSVWSSAKTVAFCPLSLYQRRYRPDSITTKPFVPDALFDFLIVVSKVYDYLLQNRNRLLKNPVIVYYAIDLLAIAISRSYQLHASAFPLDLSLQNEFNDLALQLSKIITYSSHSDINLKIESMVLLLYIDRDLRSLCQHIPITTIARIIEIYHIRQTVSAEYKQLLARIPFDDKNNTVGIYGANKTALGILHLYEHFIGSIESTITFIDSNKERGQFYNYPIINVRNINAAIKTVLITSFAHEHAMEQNLKSAHYHGLIISPYKNDICRDIFSDHETILDFLQ